MKKWISFLFVAILSLFCASCKETQTQTYVATAEYVHVESESGKADMVYGGCVLFFDLPSGERAIAGDVFHVEYTGKMYVLQSFPGQARISEGEVVGVRKEKAEFLSVVYVPATDEKASYFGKKTQDGTVEEIATYDAPKVYITDAETGAYQTLNALQTQTEFYASYSPLDGFDAEKGYRFSAFYVVDPRARA